MLYIVKGLLSSYYQAAGLDVVFRIKMLTYPLNADLSLITSVKNKTVLYVSFHFLLTKYGM
jgi:hypothetical protein